MHKRFPLLFLLLALLGTLLALASCDGGENMDNSPEQYIPGGQTGNSVFNTAGMPKFNMAPGVYTDAITVELSTDNKAYTIHYTTDCTTPTTASPVYSEPFAMKYDADKADQGACVYNIRAASFDQNGNLIGRIVCGSYLFPQKEDRFTTQIISLVTDPDCLYNEQTGIFVNFEGRGREWERPVNLSLFNKSGTMCVQQDLGMRINGTGSRKNRQKNFRFFARKDYTAETGHFEYSLFPGMLSEYTGAQIDEFDTFLVRGGASNFHNSMITNLVAYEMMEGSAIDCGNFEPASVYLNGEYYGMMMVMEDYSPYYFESHYGVDENKITTLNYTVIDNSYLGWEPDDCTESERLEWSAARHFIEDNDMTDPANYKRACEIFDMENFIQYIVFNCYVNNWDWPRNNVRVWRYHGVDGETSLSGQPGAGGYDPDAGVGFDGRWRYVMKDLDVSMGMNVDPGLNYFADPETDFFDVLYKDWRASSTRTMFESLIKNKAFEKEFFLYLCEFMSTRASVDTYLDIINTLSLQVSEEMKYHTSKYDDDLNTWDYHLQTMRSFVQVRPALVLKHLQNAKNGKGKWEVPITMEIATVTFNIEGGGTLAMNGGTFENGDVAYGVKLLDMALQALPLDGYRLKEIKVDGGTYSDGQIYLRKDNITVTAVFEEGEAPTPQDSPKPDSLVLNEIGHSSMEKVNGHDWIELYNPTEKDINLKGWSITNGEETYTLPKIIVPAGGFKVIFCSGTEEGGVYATFKIAKGDNVALYNSKGKLVDQKEILLKSSTSHLGRYPDGGEWVELSRFELTPNTPNTYASKHQHQIDDAMFHTVMIDGFLFDASLFKVDENGNLTVTAGALKNAKGLPEGLASKVTAIFELDSYQDGTVLLVSELVKKPDDQGLPCFYVDALDTYVIRLSGNVSHYPTPNE